MMTNEQIAAVFVQIYGPLTWRNARHFKPFKAGFFAGLCCACRLVPEPHAAVIRRAAGEQ